MEHVIDQLGGPAKVGRMVGCKPPSVIEWRKRGIPPDRCPSIELETDGAFPCEVLAPGVFWSRIPDPAWPWHPEGRPVIDAGRAALARKAAA